MDDAVELNGRRWRRVMYTSERSAGLHVRQSSRGVVVRVLSDVAHPLGDGPESSCLLCESASEHGCGDEWRRGLSRAESSGVRRPLTQSAALSPLVHCSHSPTNATAAKSNMRYNMHEV